MKNLFYKIQLVFCLTAGIGLNAQINSAAQKTTDFNPNPPIHLIDNGGQNNKVQLNGVEQIAMRDANTKHFKNSDGTYTAVISAAPVHYLKNKQWTEINTLIKEENNSPVNATNAMKTTFGNTSAAGIVSETSEGIVNEFLNLKKYWEVNGQPVQLVQAQNSAAVVNGSQLTYPNLFGEISARYTIQSAKRKLDFVVADAQALGEIPAGAKYLVISEDIVLPAGWTTSKTMDGLKLYDNAGKAVYLYHNPTTNDKKDFGLFNNNTGMEYSKTGNTLTIKIKVDVNYLTDANREFPITIDPTTTVYPDNADFWTTQVNSTGNGQSGLPAGGQTSAGTWYRGTITFNTSSIPASTINNADISLTTLNVAGAFGGNYLIGLSQSNYDLPVWAETFLDVYNFITNPANTAGDYVAISNPGSVGTTNTYNLGNTAKTDIAKKTGGANSFFAISVRQGWDGGTPSDRYVVYGGHNNGADAPKLILNYTQSDNYCHPTNIYANCAALGDCEYIGIAKVELNTISKTTDYNNIPIGYNRYQDQTSLTLNNDYSLKVTYKDNGQPQNTGLVAAWIDWNGNGEFDASEFIGVSAPLNNGQVQTFNITVPSNATIGDSRLRVRSVYNDEILTAEKACYSMEYGETEDYNLTLEKDQMGTVETGVSLVRIYPNPVTDFINIEIQKEIKSVAVYSLAGQQLINAKTAKVGVRQLPKGVYVIKIKTVDGKEFTEKFIKN